MNKTKLYANALPTWGVDGDLHLLRRCGNFWVGGLVHHPHLLALMLSN